MIGFVKASFAARTKSYNCFRTCMWDGGKLPRKFP